jgi:hypothetical protein
MNTSIFYGLISVVTMIFMIQAQEIAEAQVVEGNVTNSKYLSIPEHRFRGEDQITGVVVNNATGEISLPQVFAILYDNDGQVITVETGLADVTNLPPRDNSSFSISFFGIDDVARYTLIPGGTP